MGLHSPKTATNIDAGCRYSHLYRYSSTSQPFWSAQPSLILASVWLQHLVQRHGIILTNCEGKISRLYPATIAPEPYMIAIYIVAIYLGQIGYCLLLVLAHKPETKVCPSSPVCPQHCIQLFPENAGEGRRAAVSVCQLGDGWMGDCLGTYSPTVVRVLCIETTSSSSFKHSLYPPFYSVFS